MPVILMVLLQLADSPLPASSIVPKAGRVGTGDELLRVCQREKIVLALGIR